MGFKLCFALLFLCTLLFGLAIADDGKVHIVYMGSLLNNNKEELVTSHLQVLSSVLESPRHAEQSLVRSFTYAFNGFAAVLSKEQATALVGKAGVLSVFPDPVLNLHTTHSWDYLEKDLAMAGSSYRQPKSSGTDVIVGFLDTGIWPEAANFSDKGMGPVPSRWKGKCVEGDDFNASNCNRKIIGARYYSGGEDLDLVTSIKPKFVFPPIDTARDYSGHATVEKKSHFHLQTIPAVHLSLFQRILFVSAYSRHRHKCLFALYLFVFPKEEKDQIPRYTITSQQLY